MEQSGCQYWCTIPHKRINVAYPHLAVAPRHDMVSKQHKLGCRKLFSNLTSRV